MCVFVMYIYVLNSWHSSKNNKQTKKKQPKFADCFNKAQYKNQRDCCAAVKLRTDM